ncbi:hypothetical protein BgiBS90_003007 [Biomphalaria glabrata]|nr:hypothetical protein BgiBS90_003007 [Biomphalaria glabrata]
MEAHEAVSIEPIKANGRLKLVESLQKKSSSNLESPIPSKRLIESDGNQTVNRRQYSSLVRSSYEKLQSGMKAEGTIKTISYTDKTIADHSDSSNSIEGAKSHEVSLSSADQYTFRQQLEHDGNNRKNKGSLAWQEKQINGFLRSPLSSAKAQHFLGYDWIASLLENDSNVMAQNESFFQDLKSFRKKFKDDCVEEKYKEEPHRLIEVEPQIVTETLTKSKLEAFTVNERLFTENLVQNKENTTRTARDRQPKSSNVRLARVSIPQSVLQESYKVKPHRRGSFESCDSFALRDHCLMGWENSQPAMIPHARSLDLSSEVTGHKVTHTVTTLEEVEKLYAERQPTCPKELSRWRKHYLNAAKNMPIPGSSHLKRSTKENFKRTTDDLLNSTHLISFEMEKLKKERQLEKWSV